MRSPLFTFPADGQATLRLSFWVGFNAAATAEDLFAVHLVAADGTRLKTLHRVRGNGTRRSPKWKSLVKTLPASLAGQRVAIELIAVDAGPNGGVEAGVDQVRVTRE